MVSPGERKLYLTTSLPSVEVSPLEAGQAGGVNPPVETFTVTGASTLDEAGVGGEVVADAVLPRALGRVVVGVVVQDVLVDVSQHEASLLGSRDGLGDHGDVGG